MRKLVRKITVVLFFSLIMCFTFVSKSHAEVCLKREDAKFCEQQPDMAEECYQRNLMEIRERIQIESELMGLEELNELEVMAFGRKKIVTISKTTAYCPCTKCCDKDDGITYYEVKAQQFRTVAADKRKYPHGTIVHIPDLEDWPNKGWFIVEDIGGAIKDDKIDIFYYSHYDACEYGIQYHEVEFYLP